MPDEPEDRDKTPTLDNPDDLPPDQEEDESVVPEDEK